MTVKSFSKSLLKFGSNNHVAPDEVVVRSIGDDDDNAELFSVLVGRNWRRYIIYSALDVHQI